MLKIVVDTNVFISGIIFGGNPREIITAWLQKKYIFCLSPELKAEILLKLEKKFLLSQDSLSIIEETLNTYSQKYVPTQKITVCKDPQDNFLLELAEEADAEYLVSGEKLVLAMKHYKNTKIISPKDFLDIL